MWMRETIHHELASLIDQDQYQIGNRKQLSACFLKAFTMLLPLPVMIMETSREMFKSSINSFIHLTISALVWREKK